MTLALLAVLLIPLLASAASPVHEEEFMFELQRVANLPGSTLDQSQPGWIVIDTPQDFSRYFFTSNKEDPAFPAIFVRRVVESDGSIKVRTEVTCNGNKTACDSYLTQFKQQDLEMQQAFSSNSKQHNQ